MPGRPMIPDVRGSNTSGVRTAGLATHEDVMSPPQPHAAHSCCSRPATRPWS
jgi:hypothetical protein